MAKQQVNTQDYQDEVLELLQQLLDRLKSMDDHLIEQNVLLSSLVSGLTPYERSQS